MARGELERSLPENSAEVEDVRLLREQAERCRAIIARLANPEEALLGSTARLPLGAFLDDIASVHRGEDLEIRVTVSAPTNDSQVPQVWRVSDPDRVFEVITAGSVRAGATIRAQSPSAREAIKAAMRDTVTKYKRGDCFEVPAPAVLATAIKP